MQMTGHRSDAVYRRYDIVSEADLEVAARKLSGSHCQSTVTVERRTNDLQTGTPTPKAASTAS